MGLTVNHFTFLFGLDSNFLLLFGETLFELAHLHVVLDKYLPLLKGISAHYAHTTHDIIRRSALVQSVELLFQLANLFLVLT